ncbi:MAG: hypothetical protein AAF631_10525 [Pseudomonadota bacterium]
MDARLLAAALGWIVSEVLGRAAHSLNLHQRERDVQTAIMAEIEPYEKALALLDLEGSRHGGDPRPGARHTGIAPCRADRRVNSWEGVRFDLRCVWAFHDHRLWMSPDRPQ